MLKYYWFILRLNNKDVYEFYGDSNEKSFNFVKQKYENKIEDNTTYPCIIEFNKNNIGYVQFYSIACYKKCGFKECFIAKQREEKDGIKYDNLIMKIEK